MSKKFTHDIYEEQFSPKKIQDYLAGRLSSQEMHRMEALMQENPFLADTIEGLAMLPKNENLTSTLADLQQKMPYRKTGTKTLDTTHRKAWIKMSVAASVLLVLGITTIFLLNTIDSSMNQKMAESTQSVAYTADSATMPTAEAKEAAPTPPTTNDIQNSAAVVQPKPLEEKPQKVKDESTPPPAKKVMESADSPPVASAVTTSKSEGEEAEEMATQKQAIVEKADKKEETKADFEAAKSKRAMNQEALAKPTPVNLVPVGGWANYYEELAENLPKSASLPRGIVVVEAEIGVNGEVLNTKIIESLTEFCDKAAQLAVKRTGKWQVGTNNTPQTVRVKVKF